MATFRYDGEDERIFPSIRVTAKKGETFEAPDDFTAPDCVAVSASSKPSAPAVAPVSKEKPSTSDKIAGE